MIGWTVAVASTIAAIFHLYAAGISPFTALIQRPVHLALMATLGFLGVGVQQKIRRQKADRVAEDPAEHGEAEEQDEAADSAGALEAPRINWLNWLLAGVISTSATRFLALVVLPRPLLSTGTLTPTPG